MSPYGRVRADMPHDSADRASREAATAGARQHEAHKARGAAVDCVPAGAGTSPAPTHENTPAPLPRGGTSLCFIHIHIDRKDRCEIFHGRSILRPIMVTRSLV